MTTVDEIEKAILALKPDELVKLRDWFIKFDAEAWDHQLEHDVAKGRLDWLAEEALRDANEGRCTDL